MTRIFGEVAALYDDVRPGYPASVLDAIVGHHGGIPASVVDLGAGTGKGTDLLVRLGAPVTCIEPDHRMAAVLRAKFPQVEVVTTTFEEWEPPPGGVDLVGCALAWHWLDAATRNQRAHDALAPGGTLAVFGHKYWYADQSQADRIGAVLTAIDPTVQDRADHWVLGDVTASGVWSGVTEKVWHSYPVFSREKYLQLMQTFSPFRRQCAQDQAAMLAGLDAALDDFGGSVTLDLITTLVLASRV
jgi:SAM-dependent methyltransferase